MASKLKVRKLSSFSKILSVGVFYRKMRTLLWNPLAGSFRLN